ncbi:hypothetical protein ZOSMA_63G00230 [Zostera marina]|uniref:GTD-binding domain-containing protein n=1 Tax=Zostera marina TaxID=29655 RepID=A0A0K9NSY6_ZOSMR|nr:hypothetical protein ZOSMA_63G00230 [Zostera marina]
MSSEMDGYFFIQRKRKEQERERMRRRKMMRKRKLKMDQISRWDFPSLIGAYVSLGIAFLLLCCSTLAFLAEKFLSLFGLCLPCSQFNVYLVQTPPTMISRVDTLASGRTPFCPDTLAMEEEDEEEEEAEEEEETEEDEEEEEEEEEEKIEDEDEDQNPYILNHTSFISDDEDPSWNTVQESADLSDAEMVEILKRALMKEKTARQAVQNDLEKERCYAASAADESVAMILRVQKEKAMVEMNAKQYRRMIEEKAAYDEDEMEILKEMLITIEKEVYCLRKQLRPTTKARDEDDCPYEEEEEYHSEFQEKEVVSVDFYAPHVQSPPLPLPLEQQQSQTNHEIENLKQKLVAVQEGREQLNFAAVDVEEGDEFQSQLLREIGSQLQIIRRHVSSSHTPGKSRNRPKKKKRRHGSFHLGVNGSS